MEATKSSIEEWMYKQHIHVHKMDYYSDLKRKENDNIGEPWRYYARRKKPITKSHIIYNPTYIRYLEKSDS